MSVIGVQPDEQSLTGRQVTRSGRLWRRHGDLIGLGLFTAVLNLWQLSANGIGNAYYAGAVRSMTTSWSTFYYASFDPGGWITVDKPPLPYWIQAASVKVFGLNSWSLLGPNAIAGALGVVLIAATVRRVWGRVPGFAAGILLALTPTAFAMSRSNMPDQTMVLFLAAAAYATVRAVEADPDGVEPGVGGRWWRRTSGARRWMLLAGVALGAAFLCKMLAGLMTAPALWLAYLWCGRGDLRRRFATAAAAGLAVIGVAGAWVLSVDAVPAAHRPWVGGSADGTALDLVLGYNGFGRLLGQDGPGGGGFPGGADFPGGAGLPGGAGFPGGFGSGGGLGGILHLGDVGTGEQFLWAAVPALFGLLAGVVGAWRTRRRDQRLASLVIFGGWAASTWVVLGSATGISHAYYVSAIAPGIAALAGIAVALVRPTRHGAAVSSAVLVLSAALTLYLLGRTEELDWVTPVVLAATALGVAAIVWCARHGASAGWRVPATGLLLTGVVAVAPAMWIGASYGHAASGIFPDARPGTSPQAFAFGGDAPYSEAQLVWLKDNSGPGATWILAVPAAAQAGATQAAGWSILAAGGFTGSDPALTTERLADLVDTGRLRYVAAGGRGFPGASPGGAGGAGTALAAAYRSCPLVDLPGEPAGQVYDCQGKADALRAAVAGDTTAGDGAGGPAGGAPPPVALQQCLQERGVSPGAPPDPSDPAAAAAMAACFPGR